MGNSKRANYDRKYYQKNRKRLLKRGRAYRRKFAKKVLAAQRRWYKGAGKKIKRANWLLSKYGLSLACYRRLFQKQRNRCAICKIKKFDGRWSTPNVDHKGRKVRGILCTLCNVTLGALEKRPTLLRQCKPFWDYVQNPPAQEK